MSDEALLAPASESAWAVSVDNDTALSPDEPEWASSMDNDAPKTQKHQGHLFWYCCDTRRAVLIVNLINLFLQVCGLISAVVPGDGVSVDAQTTVTMAFQISFTCVVLYGAYTFNLSYITIGLLWEVYILSFWIATVSTEIAYSRFVFIITIVMLSME